jgi:acetyl-CoA acetyltransferase family protein
MTDAFVLGGVRTPFGRYGGFLSHLRTDDLLGQTMVAACTKVGVPLERVEDITAGCVNTAHEGMGDIGRWAALAAGFPDSVPAVTVNRFCASSLTGAINLAHAIRSDELAVGLAAGVESMSRSGWAQMKGDAAFSPRGPVLLLDTMWAGAGGPPNPVLLARNAYVEMIKTAQNVADRYALTREEIDTFALRSHQHAAAARDSGRFALEIHPVEILATRHEPGRLFEHDEGIRGDTSAEQLATLRPQPNTTQMTAGNSSGLNDGSSAILLASGPAAESLGITPMARVVASATHALDPQFMGIAPAFAMAKALDRARLTPDQVDLWEYTRHSPPRPSGSSESCPTSSTGSRYPTTASTRTVGRWPSAIRSGRREPGTSSRWRPSFKSVRVAMACWACALAQVREWPSSWRTPELPRHHEPGTPDAVSPMPRAR